MKFIFFWIIVILLALIWGLANVGVLQRKKLQTTRELCLDLQYSHKKLFDKYCEEFFVN